jgi:hypothetical protein
MSALPSLEERSKLEVLLRSSDPLIKTVKRILRTSCAPFFESELFSKIPGSFSKFPAIRSHSANSRVIQQNFLLNNIIQQKVLLNNIIQQIPGSIQQMFQQNPGWLASEARCELVKQLHRQYAGRRANIIMDMPI